MQTGQCSISIVIPAYNKEAYIKRAISGVLAQLYSDWELIIVDDGSTDNTAVVASGFSDSRIRVLPQANQGVSVARNNGAREARGDWVAFLDADDEWMPEFLSELVKAIHRHPQASVLFSNGYIDDGRERRLAIKQLPSASFVLDDYCGFYLKKGNGIHSSRVVVRKDVFEQSGGFPIGVVNREDLDTWARLSWTGCVACVPQPLAIKYLDVPHSASKIVRPRLKGYARIWETVAEWQAAGRIDSSQIPSALKYASHFLFLHINDLIVSGQVDLARDIYKNTREIRLGTKHNLLVRLALLLPRRLASGLWKILLRIAGLSCKIRNWLAPRRESYSGRTNKR